jgi:hypothetical protein
MSSAMAAALAASAIVMVVCVAVAWVLTGSSRQSAVWQRRFAEFERRHGEAVMLDVTTIHDQHVRTIRVGDKGVGVPARIALRRRLLARAGR